MIDVKSFSDLRAFLREYVFYRKSQDSSWTMTVWAEQMGLQALTSLTMIINGQRNCGKSIEESLIKYFDFKQDEDRHFRLLVKKDKLRPGDPLRQIIEQEIKAGSTKPKVKLTEEQFQSINTWQYFALRQLGRLTELPAEEETLKKMLIFEPTGSLVESLEKLESLGLMRKEAGGFRAIDVDMEVTASGEKPSSEPIRRYHENMGTVALQSIRKVEPEKRSFQGRTVPLKRENLPQAKALLEKFQSDFNSLVDDSGGDCVYQLNLQFFPLGEISEN